MTLGDTVEVLGQLTLEEAQGRIVELHPYGVVVRFPDGWTRLYKENDIRVLERVQAKGAGA